MVIKFNCPNGHPLSTTEERAGKPGKCPKCGASFTVPTADQLGAAAGAHVTASPEPAAATVAAGESEVPAPEGSGKSKMAAGAADAKREAAARLEALPPDHIMFLCPNGHKLNGPKRLQGKPGQCPHCGAKFRIPDYEAADEPPPHDSGMLDDIPHAELVGLSEVPLDELEEVEAVEEFPQEQELLDYAPELAEAEFAAEQAEANGEGHPLGYLVARLWREKTGPMELVLKAGGAVTPQYFSPELSQHNFAVFGLANDDGTYNIAIIAWDDIARVNVQRLKQLPKGVFE